MAKVKILADSTCDLSRELIDKFHIGIIPLTVCFDEYACKDGVEITPQDIYDYVDKNGTLPKTSAVNITDYYEVFRFWHENGCGVIHISLGAKFSSSCQNARLAANEFDDVFVLNSDNLSTGQGLLVLRAAELAEKGLSAKEIYQMLLIDVEKVEASFVIDSLDYLYKGGRCSALAMFGANLMKLKPCINVTNGRMEPGKKYKGHIEKVIPQYVEDRLKDRKDLNTDRIFITHTTCSKECVDEVKTLIKRLVPDFNEIIETTAGSTITSHCGPNTLGILFMRK